MATTRSIFILAAASTLRFLRLAATRRLRLRRDRLGQSYRIDRGGTYAIFRETVSDDGTAGGRVVLVIGFRLRFLRSWRLPHWLFQCVCILTTPFWSGFRGFRVKLWMVDPRTKNYLGIYDWAGLKQAQTYVNALARVLRPLSTRGSVWYELYPDQELEPYLRAHRTDAT
jgi:hypothetical protein